MQRKKYVAFAMLFACNNLLVVTLNIMKETRLLDFKSDIQIHF